jgi:sugar phosphate isomerase/epimerase
LSNDEEYSQHIKHLLKSIEIAPLFDTNVVRLFSFWKEQNVDDKWDLIFEKMELPIKIAEREGIILGFENVSSGNIGKSNDLVRLFNHFDSPNLKLIWDPGNAYADGEKTPYPDGYEKIKDKIVHVHVKDSVINDDGKNIWKPIGKGNVDYKGQLKALLRDNYQGVIALETHCVAENGSKIDGTKESFDGLISVINIIS